MPIQYLENPEIKERLTSAPEYRKSGLTALRLPLKSELGKELITYVRGDGGIIREESRNKIEEGKIIARNPGPISAPGQTAQFNEWLIGDKTVAKNYGQAILDGLTQEFVEHRKKGTIHAIEITKEILEILRVKEGDPLEIKVSWSDSPMIAVLGDYLTDGGYSISKNDMEKTYEPMLKPSESAKASADLGFFGSNPRITKEPGEVKLCGLAP